MDDIDKLIRIIANDIQAVDEQGKPALAVNCEPERNLLALLIAYQLGEQLAENVLGDRNA